MVDIVEDDSSGCEPKRKCVPQKSKLLTSRLENAQRSKYVFRTWKIESAIVEHFKFEKGLRNSARILSSTYVYSALLYDFSTYGNKFLCQHILFVYLFDGKGRILTFWIKLNLRHIKLRTFSRTPTLILSSKERKQQLQQLTKSQRHSSERSQRPFR